MLSVEIPTQNDLTVDISTDRRLIKQSVRRAQLLRSAMRGLTAKEAAETVGCSHATALAAYRDPEFKRDVMRKVEGAFQEVDKNFVETKQTLNERLTATAERSFELLVEMLEDKETASGHRINIAQDFLNRNPETSQVNRTVTFNEEQLRIAGKTAKEMEIPYEEIA